ncbi:uncharacterized protein FOMMEDRAFT_158836 [Fomitiporia mediterranea MF3/22]|uniref:uncharacterized protein n=1 Tax=Fomitiporia mediterranea (strain MF3/22) TaxID=694068 RepID=UPI0004407691|nr:uncharacterized protein FOMMEDRAFT_158836 [Fomitiporia mediterranea MF3/22]EJD01683.1 hypothetical protein FOMMEDRAFT_158836 [Fomitiporia mediterranea MF3/22]
MALAELNWTIEFGGKLLFTCCWTSPLTAGYGNRNSNGAAKKIADYGGPRLSQVRTVVESGHRSEYSQKRSPVYFHEALMLTCWCIQCLFEIVFMKSGLRCEHNKGGWD